MALEFVQVKEEPPWEGQAPPSQCTVHMVNQDLMVELEVVQDADPKKCADLLMNIGVVVPRVNSRLCNRKPIALPLTRTTAEKVEMDSRCRTSMDQFTALLEFMEEHGDLGRAGPGGAGRLRGDRLWTQLDLRLSAVASGARKTCDKWKKVWADWKGKTKRKALEIRARGDPPGPPRPPGPRASLAGRSMLTPLEQRLLAVVAAAGRPTRPAEAPQEPFLPPPPPPPPPQVVAPPLPLAPPAIVPDVEGPAPPKRPRTPRPSSAGFTRHKRTRRRTHTRLESLKRRRLRLEEEREKNLHERETEKLKLEAKRIEVDCERNIQLKRLADTAESFIDKFGGLVGGRSVKIENGFS